MGQPSQPAANGFVRVMRKVYNPIGFSKGYNFVLAFLALGYLLGFSLARLEYLSFNGVFCNPNGSNGPTGAAPGECFFYLQDPYKIGMKLHLFCIIPASILACFQFIPVIRHKVMLFHRMNGYIVVILALISSAGTLIIARHAFGGDFATQTFVGMLVILTTIGLILAYINIKLLQIDQHRAWMIRTWGWFATIVTVRIIMIISAQIISKSPDWFTVRPCAQIASVLGEKGTLAYYPGCGAYFDGSNPNKQVVVTVDFASQNPIELAAALAVPFGAAGWIAIVLHTFAVELYLRLTPVESDRLRKVSYERQLARGFSRPGYAGLTAERFGDAAPYVPPGSDEHEMRQAKTLDEEATSESGRNTSYMTETSR